MKTLQFGLEWMPESAGGLPRYYYESWQASHGLYNVRGLVIGSDKVAKASHGEAIGSAPLLRRMAKARFSPEICFPRIDAVICSVARQQPAPPIRSQVNHAADHRFELGQGDLRVIGCPVPCAPVLL